MPLAEGTRSWDWELAEPNRLLSLMVRESDALQELFRRAIELHSPSQENPWTLILGYDEFSPGGMKDLNDRKTMNLPYTFLQLGEHNIRSDAAWFTPVIVRHALVNDVSGSWGAMLLEYLRIHLLGQSGFSTAGVPVTIDGEHVMIYASLDFMVADLDGHREGLDVKGANGYKCCIRHFPGFLKQQVKATIARFQAMMDVGKACSTDIKKPMPDMQDFGWSIRVTLGTVLDGHE